MSDKPRPPTSTALRAGVAIAVDVLIARIEELEKENAYLKKENRELWEAEDERQTA